VRDDAVPLHLAETQAAVSRAALHRLPREDLHRPAPSRVYFVVHHVLEALVVGGVEEDLGLQLSPRVPVVHHLPTAALVATPALRASVGDGFVKRKAVVRGCRVAIRRQRVSSCCFFPAWPMPCSLQPAHTAHLCSAAEILSTVTDVKGVASPSLPMQAATCKKRRIQ
jgi:hypothetical protein